MVRLRPSRPGQRIIFQRKAAVLKFATGARDNHPAITADSVRAADAVASGRVLLSLFPVPLDDPFPDLERNGVFHILFILYNDGRREHDKFVIFLPDTFVLEDFAAVIGQDLLARLAERLDYPVSRCLAALYTLERIFFNARVLLVSFADHTAGNQNRSGYHSRNKTNLAAFVQFHLVLLLTSAHFFFG